MQSALTQQEQKTVVAQAWRVFFDDGREAAQPSAIAIREPRVVSAIVTPIDVRQTLALQAPADDGSLDIVWMPPGANEQSSIERDVEAWIDNGATPLRRAPIRAGIRTIRVFWHDARVLLYANAEQLEDALDAIVRFTVVEREAAALEAAMNSIWSTIDADAPLTHAGAGRQQKRQQHVNEMTEIATRMKIIRLRVETALEQLDTRLAESSKRLYSELTLAAALHDRLEKLDEPVQFALDHYELANNRLIDAKAASRDRAHALTGHVLEVAVVLLLLAELVATIYQLRITA